MSTIPDKLKKTHTVQTNTSTLDPSIRSEFFLTLTKRGLNCPCSIIWSCISNASVPVAFLVAERQILSQHKQNNNLVVMVSKGIQFVDLVYKLHVGSKNIIFTFTGTLQISRGFLFFFWLPLKRIF